MTAPLDSTEYECAKGKCSAHIVVRIPAVAVEHLCSGQNNTIRPMQARAPRLPVKDLMSAILRQPIAEAD